MTRESNSDAVKSRESQPCIAPLVSTLEAVRKAISRAGRDRRFVKSINSKSTISRLAGSEFGVFSGDYLISGDKGIYAIRKGTFLRLFNTRTFGIAIRGNELFAACSNDHYSSICKASLPADIAADERLRFSEIFRTPTSKSGRIHQIAFYNDQLAVAHTDGNAILFLCPDSGELLSECRPFRDHFGDPIPGDHNHLNSVSQCGECLLFCAYKAGDRALLGVLHGDRVKAYPIRNVGAHDIHLEGRNLWHSDTFGLSVDKGGDGCGYPMKNNRRVDGESFSAPPGKVMRGVAGTGEELLVGHSHKGPRAKRYDGNGSIIRLVGEKVVGETTVPFSQVYDILRLDGRHFDEPPAFVTWDDVNDHFTSILGPCVYEQTLG
jgi:hypothetical protein